MTKKKFWLLTFCKALIWRTFSVMVTGSLIYFMTGELVLAVTIGIIDTIIKIICFMIHEKIWYKYLNKDE